MRPTGQVYSAPIASQQEREWRIVEGGDGKESRGERGRRVGEGEEGG